MEIFGRPGTVAETQMKVRIQSAAQKRQSKRDRGFFEKQETVESRRKRKMTMRCSQHHSTASWYLILEASLVAVCGCFPGSCCEVTVWPDSYSESVQDIGERAKSELPEVIRTVCNRSYVNTGRKEQLVHHIQLSSSKEMHPRIKGTALILRQQRVYMEGVLGYAREGRCVHPLEPGSHKELGVRLLITFGNSQERFVQTQRRRTTGKWKSTGTGLFLKVGKLYECLLTDPV